MEEVTVSAVIYNNGRQAYSKDLRPIAKPISGTITVINANNLSPVNIACGGVGTAFNTTLPENKFAVSIHAALAFCSSNPMPVAVVITFSIPGELFIFN